MPKKAGRRYPYTAPTTKSPKKKGSKKRKSKKGY